MKTFSWNKYAQIITRYYIHINIQNNYHKKVCIQTPKIFYYDTHKIILKNVFLFLYIQKWTEKILCSIKNQE